ncbi:MAG: glycosyltransferase [Candidatus Methanoperedenaceae archaeon]|nr:glycosyltransferase [Candidatus Methanoperedenaceae archaeon]
MRILYFSKDYTTHDRRFLSKLGKSRHDVWFLRLEDDGIPYEKGPLPPEIRQVDWRGGQKPVSTPDEWLRLMPDFEKVLNDIQPDLVHAGPVQSCGFMTALAGFHPFLVMSWGSDILVKADQDDFWKWLTCYTLRHSDMLLSDCRAVSVKVQQLVGYADERIIQFPWGIDLNNFAPGAGSFELRKRMDLEDAFVILSTRSLEQIYGIDVLLDAFRRAHALNPRLRLVMLGDGSLSFNIARFISEHAFNDIIYCPGMVPHEQLPDYFRMVDLYLSCAHSDGSSISLLEAMATGLPVVVTDALGNREWVVQGKNGWLAPAGDPEEFARLLLQAADLDTAERKQICRRNRQMTEERANWDINFKKLIKAYDKMASISPFSGHVR